MASSTRKLRQEVLRKKSQRRQIESSFAEEEASENSIQDIEEMTSSEASDESYIVPSHTVDPEYSSESDFGNSSSPEREHRNISRKAQSMIQHAISRPAKCKSQTPFTLNFYLQQPQPAIKEIFSTHQLQQLGLTALASEESPIDVLGDMVHELLNPFSKVRGHNLTPTRIGHALGMTTFPAVIPATHTYSGLSKDATIQGSTVSSTLYLVDFTRFYTHLCSLGPRGSEHRWFAKRFLHPDVVEPFEYIFIWDEDLDVEHFNAEEYIRLVRKHGLEISQPGLEPDRGLTWQMTKRLGNSEVHKSTEEKPGWCPDPHKPPCAGFVEIMAPVFSRTAWRCVWHMIQNDLVHGWGLDFTLGKCAEPAHEKIGVVDSQYIVHKVVPSLGKQGSAAAGKAPWEGVRERCHKEWKTYKERMQQAEKEDRQASE
ncbi:hypothetical protein L7F22_013148 [Adiantum nelumboides]|nr:hypothetical protein [Adiantum nelumboides]